MKDRLLCASFAGALLVHLGVIAAGGALSPYLGHAGESEPMRTIEIGLQAPEPAPPPVTPQMPRPEKPAPQVAPRVAPPPPASPAPPITTPAPSPGPPAPRDSGRPVPARVAASSPTAPREEPGGALNVGTPSERGEIEGLISGRTPVGWVPGDDAGKGAGSGSGEGVGQPEPPPQPLPQPTPAPAANPVPPPPPPQPQPRRVSVRVCALSRLRPNPHCPESITVQVAEGSEPAGVCHLHKPPPPPAPLALPPPKPEPRPEPAPAPESPLTPARLVRTVKPRYPSSALLGNHEGAVSLKVEVRADGSPGEVEVVRSSGSRALDAAAVKAVKQWRWKPARRGDEPVVSTARCRVRFELEE
ncbi:MAG TPA: energy transducer TonB [Armatimonadetes bacterium]|nr:energy transducer TonB [Armatimonadota bacterium]